MHDQISEGIFLKEDFSKLCCNYCRGCKYNSLDNLANLNDFVEIELFLFTRKQIN